jgi:hypothetical protein
MENRRIAVTSPAGNWDYYQLLGASVKVSSLSVSKSMFGYDETQTYLIKDIKIRINSFGQCFSSIYLEGIDTPFVWKDLELVGLDLFMYPPSICSDCLLCGQAICGYEVDSTTTAS